MVMPHCFGKLSFDEYSRGFQYEGADRTNQCVVLYLIPSFNFARLTRGTHTPSESWKLYLFEKPMQILRSFLFGFLINQFILHAASNVVLANVYWLIFVRPSPPLSRRSSVRPSCPCTPLSVRCVEYCMWHKMFYVVWSIV